MAENWLKLAQDAYEGSTSYFDANYRSKIEYALRAFQNEHAPGSKYNSEDYRGRSKIFRPKTRTIIRKNEAAATIALFSNPDVVMVTAEDTSNPQSVASAEVNKYLLQYRLNKTIPWFKLCMGSLQDAQSVGIVCSYQYWDYKQVTDPDGMRRVVKDEPCIKLRPIENIRFDPAADWMDPVNTSPYFIDIIPMYVCDVKAMMKADDPKTGLPRWKRYDDDVISQARSSETDTTRLIRSKLNVDPHEEDHAFTDHDIVWVFKFFMRRDAQDFCFFTLGRDHLLTGPVLAREIYFHGVRPYVIGCSIIEAHKPIPEGVPSLVRPIQAESNEIANSRLDNVKLVLNKRWFVGRGRQVDTASLLRNVPGGVTLMNDPTMDVKEVSWTDVTGSSYAEQDRLNVDFDELAGNFSGSSVMTNRQLNETVGGMRMLSQGASVMTEYLLRTWIETWVEPVLRQLVLLEQYYETNQTVLALAGKKAQLYQRFGVNQATDQMLMAELIVTVNVGQGATDPQARMQKFVLAANTAIGLIANAPPTANVTEMINEVFSYAGFRDASRFFGNVDPRLPKAMQIIQQLQGQLQGKQMEMQADAQIEQAKIASNERIKVAEIEVNQFRIQGDLKVREAEIAIQQAELELEKIKLYAQTEGTSAEHRLKIAEMSAKVEDAALQLANETQRIAMEAQKTNQEMRLAEAQSNQAQGNENRIDAVTQRVGEIMHEVSAGIDSMKAEIADAKSSKAEVNQLRAAMAEMAKGINAVAQNVTQMNVKPKMTGYKVQKEGNKRTGLLVTFDDGSQRLLTEQ